MDGANQIAGQVLFSGGAPEYFQTGSSPTAGVDCFVLCLFKDMGLASLLTLLGLLHLPYKQWPPEILWILHLTLF